jgi:hypothetical protein
MPDGAQRKRWIKDGLMALQSGLKGELIQTHVDGDCTNERKSFDFCLGLIV